MTEDDIMENRQENPHTPESNDKGQDKTIVEHVLNTGLPPGISPNEARDPGNPHKQPGTQPVTDNRS
jgi:hypothetical protein